MRFKTDWASLIVGSKFTVFALFYCVFEGNFPSTNPRGAYVWRSDLTEGFCVSVLGGLYLEGLLHGGAYFRNFTVFNCFHHDYIAKIRLGKKIHLNMSQKRQTKVRDTQQNEALI